ncbi:hypothetical protein FA95DRAFT_1286011 [Auriscalpium vulgare]|uniref:Uncharacterized protein n=1 Tax=Auriscalpium vulgare TaxID=40419 RepID=A0ACB8R220_9AGAM|nr:hypothetical protein FA95DRAFT_1286011 [Auriscalpium vulgare]
MGSRVESPTLRSRVSHLLSHCRTRYPPTSSMPRDFALELAFAGANVSVGRRSGAAVVADGPALASLRLSNGRIRKPRRPAAGNEYTPSPFRKSCLASDRLLKWTTPYGLVWAAEQRRLLSPRVFAHRQLVMVSSVVESTRGTYGAGLLRFTQFCDSLAIAEGARMPAADDLLAAFASSAAAVVGAHAVTQWMFGLRMWHELNGAPWLGGTMLARAVKVPPFVCSLASHVAYYVWLFFRVSPSSRCRLPPAPFALPSPSPTCRPCMTV